MATAGPNFPSTGTNTTGSPGGTTAWVNPGNITADDGVFATVSTSGSTITELLTGTGFGFAIPAGATINGILCEAKVANGGTGQAKDSACRLILAGVVQATDRASSTNWSSTNTYLSHGGSADLWGATVAPSDINNSNFGFCLAAHRTAGKASQALRCDAFRITITYTPGGATVPTDMRMGFGF